ncbi:MAG TPA: hypothetical protein VGE31_01885 [Candidatus Paceibacterota bacterium]
MHERFQGETGVEVMESSEAVHVVETSELIKADLMEELLARHSSKIFHEPAHTVPTGREDFTSVVGGVRTLSGILKESFPRSLPKTDSVALTLAGMEAGAFAHDVIIEINGVTENGAVVRRRGWEPGGNERESFRYLRRHYLEKYIGSEDELSPEEEELLHSLLTDENGPEYDPLYQRYMEAAERTVEATEPDKFQFAYEVDADLYLSQYSEEVKEALRASNWTKEHPQYCCMMIDSSKTAIALESLLGSTADLGAVSDPEVFARTGNAEFWESQYGIAKDCAQFLNDPNSLEPFRVSAIAESMQGWRKSQVGVALGQHIRLTKNYTPENITTLFETTFGVSPDPDEVDQFIARVQESMQGAEESVRECARIYKEFTQRFGSLIERDAVPLTDEEKALFTEAIAYMNGDEAVLTNYVSHVDEELKKQST